MTSHPDSDGPQDDRPSTRPRQASRCWLALLAALPACATVPVDNGQALVPTRYQVNAGPFTVYSGVPIGPKSGVVRTLESLEGDLTATLGLRASGGGPPVEVYVLRDRDAFTKFLTFHHPELPPRRAFFLAKGNQRIVYTFFNDRLEEDLRHEATHAVLHASVGNLPLWLDEGLAEYFEVHGGRKGWNLEHVGRLPDDLRGGWRPDLARLESLRSVGEMSPRDYREAWAWAHFLLNEPRQGKAALLAYLGDLRDAAGAVAPLSDRLGGIEGGPAPRMLAHLRQARDAPAAPVASSRTVDEPKVLFQNVPLGKVVTVEPPPPKGVFGRFFQLFQPRRSGP